MRFSLPQRLFATIFKKHHHAFFVSLALCMVFFGIIVTMYLKLPKNGDIWWSDASRNALNGAFVLDFLKAAPLHDPIEYALDYYRQYPGLTILFYPPVFYLVVAGFYAVLGVSEASALAAEFAFLLLLAWGAFRLSRHWLEPLPAAAVALLLIGAPQLAFWGQQIMLDVPAYAFLLWAADFLVRYLHTRSKGALYAAVVGIVAAVYTKYNAVFFAAVLAIAVFYLHGWRVFRDGTVLRGAALASVLLLPAAVIFFHFASYDLEQATSMAGAPARWSVEGLTYYARIMPSVVSWPTLVLACLFVLALAWRAEFRLDRADAVLLIAWVSVGYLFYAMISIKEPRHILFVTFPFALAAILLLDRLLSGSRFRYAAVLALAGGVLAHTLATGTVPFLAGTRQAAQMVAALAQPDINVGYWGDNDGNFIYAMRAYTGRRDLGVVRIDKLLFRNRKVYFGQGATEVVMQPAEIVEMLARLHVQYVVAETGSHAELDAVEKLHAALRSDKFTEVGRIPMLGNFRDGVIDELTVYRLNQEVPPGRVAPPMEIKLLDRRL